MDFAGRLAPVRLNPGHVPADPSRVSSRTRKLSGNALGILVPLWLAVVVSCSSGDGSDGKPAALRVVKAVVTSLLSGSPETRQEIRAAEDPPPAAEPGLALHAPPQTCTVPYAGPVTIVPVRTPAALQRGVSERRDVALVYETDDTAIWEDGRVLTLDVENLGSHLNAVGWATNPMRILGASTRPGSSGANFGWSSGQSSFQSSAAAKPKKRRRRG